MALAPAVDNPGGTSTDAYTLVATRSDFETKGNSQLVPIEEITASSVLYGVEFTFNVTQQAFQTDGAKNLAQEKTAQVNEIGAHPHVIGMRGEQDQGTDGKLYNYLVVTVGTDDGLISTDVKIRMDQIGNPSAFSTIDKAWDNLVSLGA